MILLSKILHISDMNTREENIWNKCPVLVIANGKNDLTRALTDLVKGHILSDRL
jgi:hypothetical protein